MEEFKKLLQELLFFAPVVIGLTQLAKEGLIELKITSKVLVKLVAVLIGMAIGFIFLNGELLGLAAGLVMGLVVTGNVSFANEKIEQSKTTIEVGDVAVENVENIENIESPKK